MQNLPAKTCFLCFPESKTSEASDIKHYEQKHKELCENKTCGALINLLNHRHIHSEISVVTNGLKIQGNESEIKEIMDSKEVKQIINEQKYDLVGDFKIKLVDTAFRKSGYKSPKIKKLPSASECKTLLRTNSIIDSSGITWGLNSINVSPVRRAGFTGKNMLVAVADTGVALNRQLLPNYSGQWLDVSGTNYTTPKDKNGHGTHVCGTICAKHYNYYRISVAPNAKWMGLKVLDDSGSGYFSDFANACNTMLSNIQKKLWVAPDVLNCSFGADIANQYHNILLETALNNLYNSGIMVCFAIGNNSRYMSYPGALLNSFSVGAIDEKNKVPYWASHGISVYSSRRNPDYKPEVSCPGTRVLSCVPDDYVPYVYPDGSTEAVYIDANGTKYCVWNGTSMATPHCAGIVLLVKQMLISKNKLIKQVSQVKPQLITVISNSIVDLGARGDDSTYGMGRIDVTKTFNSL